MLTVADILSHYNKGEKEMIRVNGLATFELNYVMDIAMTEEEWDALSEGEKKNEIDYLIGMEGMESAEMTECDVWDVVEISNE